MTMLMTTRPSEDSDVTNSATYSYLANSALVEQITFKEDTTTRMTTTKAYDYINRLTSISHADGATTLASYAYGYNAANQRTNVTHADNSHWTFGYDDLGQVTSGKKRNSGDQLFPGLQYEYDFDDIGNRIQTRSGGDGNGSNLRTNNYSANLLNQYTNRDVGPYLEVHGEAATNSTVTVNNQATERLGSFYRKELNPDNSASTILQGITNVAVIKNGGTNNQDIVTIEEGSKLLEQDPESFTYDADGNLTSDALWTNTWNGENRLIEMESLAAVPATARKKLLFEYDHQGRRIRKEVLTWDQASSSYLPTSTNLFVYDGWNLIAELDGNTNFVHGFAWGLDLSGSEQGAGGVGGLLLIQTTNSVHLVGHDGNGNVSVLADGSDSAVTAQYEYSPFGQVIRASGITALANPFRFSSKYQDDETGFNYYGYRFYNPDTGRWLSRDPIEEMGGENIYEALLNNGVSVIDSLGRKGTIDPGPRQECEFLVDSCWNGAPIGCPVFIRNLVVAIRRNDCPLQKPKCFKCDAALCQLHKGKIIGGYDSEDGRHLFLCPYNMSAGQLTSTLYHELIHAYDRCHGFQSWMNADDSICTEIRAYHHSGVCSRHRIGSQGYKNCIYDKAMISCRGRFTKEQCEDAFKKKYNECMQMRILWGKQNSH